MHSANNLTRDNSTGLTIQWGIVTHENGELTFPRAFLDTNYVIVAGASVAYGIGGSCFKAVHTSGSMCNIYASYSNDGKLYTGWNLAGRHLNPQWIAIGFS